MLPWSSISADILADFLPGLCCPSAFVLEEGEYLQQFCTGICQVTPPLYLPQEAAVYHFPGSFSGKGSQAICK